MLRWGVGGLSFDLTDTSLRGGDTRFFTFVFVPPRTALGRSVARCSAFCVIRVASHCVSSCLARCHCHVRVPLRFASHSAADLDATMPPKCEFRVDESPMSRRKGMALRMSLAFDRYANMDWEEIVNSEVHELHSYLGEVCGVMQVYRDAAKEVLADLDRGPRQPIAASGICTHTVAPATVQPRTTACGTEVPAPPAPPCHASSQTEPVPRTRKRRRAGKRRKPPATSSTLTASASGVSDCPPRGAARACGTAFAPRMCIAFAQGECTHGKRCFHMHRDTDAERRRATRRRILVAQGLAGCSARSGPIASVAVPYSYGPAEVADWATSCMRNSHSTRACVENIGRCSRGWRTSAPNTRAGGSYPGAWSAPTS